MENFKIYQNGHYNTLANIKMKLRNKINEQLPVIADKIDYIFTEAGR